MELINTLAVTNEADKNTLKKKKRKYSLIKDESDVDLSKSGVHVKKKKKVKKLADDLLIYNQSPIKYMQYKNTNYYTSVVANPESLQPTPQIFKKFKFTNSVNNYSESLLFDLISMRSFNTDVGQRFNHVALISQNYNSGTTEKLDITKNDSSKREPTKKKKEKLELDLNSERNSLLEEKSNWNQIKLYEVKENRGLIIHMLYKSSFSFHGEIKVTILSGEVEILGFALSHLSDKKSVNVYSPNFYTALVMETKHPKENKSKVEIESVLQDYVSAKDMKSILSDFSSNDAVLFIEKIDSVFGIVVNEYWEKHLFPKDLENVSCASQTVKSVQSVFNLRLTPKGRHFKKNPQWDNIPLGGCTVLCGGKGVGKSMLLKYYMNKLLTQGEKVLCLDFDVGQPEFTASGCVSAVVVDQPLLGPNFTHVKDPELMIYFGDIDVVQNPVRYLESVKYVIESCKKNVEFCRMKWFVNTMGFCKGLGIYLMTTILKLLQPNTVIQIQSSPKNSYPFFLTATNLNSRAGFKSMPLEEVQLTHDLRIVKSYAGKNEFGKKGELSQGTLKPRQLRDIMSLAYFSRMVSPPYYNFNAVKPYLISFSKLYLGINSLIDFNDILKAFNANIVSLVNFEPDSEEVYSVESDEEDYFKIVVKPELTPCLGLGLVRGIDCNEKKFYIVTHLSLEILNKVNCLCLEKISPPHSMFTKQETVEGQSVYTTTGTANVIKRVKRVFHGSAINR